MTLACMPWYHFPETERAQDVLWAIIASHLRQRGVPQAPPRLTRDAPVNVMLADPELLLGQCCGYDIVYGFSGSLDIVATPLYTAQGCSGTDYRSFVLVREDCPAKSIAGMRNSIGIINGFTSHSGTNSLRSVVAPFSQNGRFFRQVKISGGHVNSLPMLRAGEGDIIAMDCVIHAMFRRFRPAALKGTRVLCWTDAAPAPPLVTANTNAGALCHTVREAVFAALADPESEQARDHLMIGSAEYIPLHHYARIVEHEAVALKHDYMELHSTFSPTELAGDGA